MATYVASEPATTASIRSSARPPETSFTIRAPASRARSATSARIVSTETTAPSRRQRLDDREHPGQLLGRQRPGGARAGGLAAHVDDVGAVRDELPAVRDRRLGSAQRPPSENESGVTLTTPISRGP